jgi:SNF2 family DNA or RNA helicase
VHRIGQKKPVEVTRLTIKGTVEDRILELQDKKRELARYLSLSCLPHLRRYCSLVVGCLVSINNSAALDDGKFNSGRLSLDDLNHLFNS